MKPILLLNFLILFIRFNSFSQTDELITNYSFSAPSEYPAGIEYYNSNLWISDIENSTIYKTDTSGVIQDSIIIENVRINGFTFHKDDLWIASNLEINNSRFLYKIDYSNGSKIDSIAISNNYWLEDLCSDGNNLYLTRSSGVYEVDLVHKSFSPRSYLVITSLEYYRGIFLAISSNKFLILNDNFSKIKTYSTNIPITDLAHDGDNIWICNSANNTINRVNNIKLSEINFPNLKNLQVLSDYPSESDSIRLSFEIEFLKGGCSSIYETTFPNDSTIEISLNYNSALSCQKAIVDTFNIGKVQNGDYHLIFSVIDVGSYNKVNDIDTLKFKVYPWSNKICDHFYVEDIIKTFNNDYAITGWNSDNTNDVVVKLVSKNGELVWSKQFGGNSYDYGKATCPVENNTYYVAGSTSSFSKGGYGDDDFWVLKLDDKGDTIWAKTYGGSNMDKAFALCQMDDNLYICGLSRSYGSIGDNNIFVIKIDKNGKLIWKETYGLGMAYDIKVTNDKNLVITGSTGDEAFIMKVDKNGLKKWSVTNNLGESRDCGYEVYELADKNYLVTGEGNFLTGQRFESYFLSDSVGNLLKEQKNSRNNFNETNYIFWLDTLNIPFVKNLHFDYRYYIEKEMDSSCFVIRSIITGIYAYKIYTNMFTSQTTDNISQQFIDDSNFNLVYPNPVNEKLNIKNHNYNLLQVYNMYGIKMMTVYINNKNQIDLSNLQKGAYLLLFIGKQNYCTKILKQ